eukprot:2825379-Amphidinium_carterae.1
MAEVVTLAYCLTALAAFDAFLVALASPIYAASLSYLCAAPVDCERGKTCSETLYEQCLHDPRRSERLHFKWPFSFGGVLRESLAPVWCSKLMRLLDSDATGTMRTLHVVCRWSSSTTTNLT